MSTPKAFRHQQPSSPEHATSVRYSLALETVRSTDMMVGHPSGRMRVISYPAPTDERRKGYGERLWEKGLILGEKLGAETARTNAFKVPLSARPIAYDESSDSQGAFSYGDDQLFFDLGGLLASPYNPETGQNVTVTGEVGRAIAFVEFTHSDERRLFFVPGVERIAGEMSLEESRDYYVEQLTAEFGPAFERGADYFLMGFAEATET